MVYHAHILGAHYKRIPAVLNNGQKLILPLFLGYLRALCARADIVYPSAGLRAGTAVCVAPDIVLTQKAASAVRYAHRAVNKAFKLHFIRNISAYLPYFRKGKLAGKHDA